MKVLITGSNGLLGQKLIKFCMNQGLSFKGVSIGPNRNPECLEKDYQSLDLTNYTEVDYFFRENEFTHIIHTAAMTNVDACELNPDLCFEINHKASTYLFDIAQSKNIHFTFLSTDFVFDGKKGDYSEGDVPNPLSAYGRSKWMAEQNIILSPYSNWAISRTIIVYGKGHAINKSNIFSWLINELSQGNQVSLITDHFRAPTWAEDLAEACLAIVQKNKKGIYHLSGPETLSIYEIGLRVAKYLGVSEDLIIPINSNTLNQPAVRPPLTGFNLTKAKEELDYNPHPIEYTLDYL